MYHCLLISMLGSDDQRICRSYQIDSINEIEIVKEKNHKSKDKIILYMR